MNVLTKFVINDLKLNRKRSIGILIGIILSVMLICTVSCIFSSYNKTTLQKDIDYSGYWHISLFDIDESKLEKLTLNKNVNMVKSVYNNYYQYTNQTNNKVDNLAISFMDEETFNYLKYQKLDGNYPQNENEILVSKSLLKKIDKKLGDEINLTEEQEDNIDSNSIDINESSIIEKSPIKYKIVGTYDAFYFDKTTAISTHKKEGSIDAYVVLKDPYDYKDALANILEIDKFDYALYENDELAKTKYIYELNSVLFDEVHPIESKYIQVTLLAIALIFIIIIYTSIYSIRNSFSISQTEKLKMHGMLASIGATSKQLKNSMVLEGLILGIIGIPIGILLSIIVTYGLVLMINSIQFTDIFSIQFSYSISWKAIFLSILLSFVTILLSTRRAAMKASRVSPIDNLRSSTDIKSERKIKKMPKLIDKLFGIGGVIAYKSIKRSSKKYHTTIVALAISVFMFITTSYLLKNDLQPQPVSNGYNIQIYPSSFNKKFDPKDIEKISQLPNVEKMYYVDTMINSIYSSDNEKVYSYKLFNEKNEVIYQDLTYIALDDNTFKDYLQTLKLDYNNMKDKAILYIPKGELLDSIKASSLDTLFSTEISLEVNDTFYGRIRSTIVVDKRGDEEVDDGILYKFDIGYKTEKLPFDCIESQGRTIPYENPIIIVNKANYPTISNPLSSFINIKANDPNLIEEQIEKINIDYSINNFYAIQKMMKSVTLCANILVYCVIGILSIIGITNIFNTITSNMNLRQKEFAILKSIGMTKKEFNRMINLEVILYSFKSLFYGISLSILITLIYHCNNASDGESYQFPWLYIMISIVVVLVIVYFIMKYSINKTNKQNIIETIRNDNV